MKIYQMNDVGCHLNWHEVPIQLNSDLIEFKSKFWFNSSALNKFLNSIEEKWDTNWLKEFVHDYGVEKTNMVKSQLWKDMFWFFLP